MNIISTFIIELQYQYEYVPAGVPIYSIFFNIPEPHTQPLTVMAVI